MDQYEYALAAAYVRGAAQNHGEILPDALVRKDLADLTQDDLQTILSRGQAAGLRMYHFKKKDLLPRVNMVLGILKGIQPESLLDVGSGRGVFLFPFLQHFSWVPVTSLDVLAHRVEMLQCIHAGGVTQLNALQQDICTWDMPDDSFDVVTMLEVLEHIKDVQAAVNAAVRLAKRYVILSVPSKPDDNPEHIHLLTKDILTELFQNTGCHKLHFDGVNGHLLMMATL